MLTKTEMQKTQDSKIQLNDESSIMLFSFFCQMSFQSLQVKPCVMMRGFRQDSVEDGKHINSVNKDNICDVNAPH